MIRSIRASLEPVSYTHLGIKDARLEEVREKFPERIIENAVKGMLPKNKLSPERMARLKVFAGSEHAHAAQKPEKITIKVEVK